MAEVQNENVNISIATQLPITASTEPSEEPLNGGYTRFELELEVSCAASTNLLCLLQRDALITSVAVCSITRKPLLPQPPRLPETPARP